MTRALLLAVFTLTLTLGCSNKTDSKADCGTRCEKPRCAQVKAKCEAQYDKTRCPKTATDKCNSKTKCGKSLCPKIKADKRNCETQSKTKCETKAAKPSSTQPAE